MGSKQFLPLIILLGLIAYGLSHPQKEDSTSTPAGTTSESNVPASETSDGTTTAPKMSPLEEERVQKALEGATHILQNNMIGALSSIAQAGAVAGTNVTRASALLIRGLVMNSFSLAGIATYMPRLIFLDGPSQFIEVLKLIRSNQLRLPNDLDSAIDTMLVFAGQVRDSGIGGNLSPLVTFFPNIFAGVGEYLTTLIDTVFTFLAPV